MPDEDDFLQRLRGPAATLRHQPDAATLSRIRAQIQARIERPSVAELLAGWLRPVATAFAALTLAVTIGMLATSTEDSLALDSMPVDINMAGETYRVDD